MNDQDIKKEHEMNDGQGKDMPGMDPIREHILNAIKEGEVTMRPRWHFVVKTILVAAGALLIFLGTIYLASFIIFVLYKTGVIYVPDFGLHGIMRFLIGLPWVLIFVAFVFAVFLEVLVQRYAFVYKKPLLYSVCGVLILVVAGSVIVAATPLHSQFFKNSRERQLPFFPGQLYIQFGFQRTDGIHRGVVTSITDNGFYLKEDSDNAYDTMIASSSPNSDTEASTTLMSTNVSSTTSDTLIQVVVTPETRFPAGTAISVGDSVVVFGDDQATSSVFQAYGIEKVTDGLEANTGMYPGEGTSSFPRPAPNSRVFYIHFSQ